jgi:hypothetical protein
MEPIEENRHSLEVMDRTSGLLHLPFITTITRQITSIVVGFLADTEDLFPTGSGFLGWTWSIRVDVVLVLLIRA